MFSLLSGEATSVSSDGSDTVTQPAEQFCFENGAGGGGQVGGGGGGGSQSFQWTPPAPSNTPKTKSPARQACEAKAQQKYSQAKGAAFDNFRKGFITGAGVTATFAAGAGCAVGTGVGGFTGAAATAFLGGEGAILTAPAGCAAGGTAAVVSQAPAIVSVGLVSGGLLYLGDIDAAKQQLAQDMDTCSSL